MERQPLKLKLLLGRLRINMLICPTPHDFCSHHWTGHFGELNEMGTTHVEAKDHPICWSASVRSRTDQLAGMGKVI